MFSLICQRLSVRKQLIGIFSVSLEKTKQPASDISAHERERERCLREREMLERKREREREILTARALTTDDIIKTCTVDRPMPILHLYDSTPPRCD